MPKQYRADKNGPHRVAFERARKRLLQTQNSCGICGREIDKSLKYPNPLPAVVDLSLIHISEPTRPY